MNLIGLGALDMRILVVDDDAPTRALLVRSLGRSGHVPVAVGSCSEATALTEAERFDLLVLDVMLPDGSGVELCWTLRESRLTTPVLLLTARGVVGDRVAGLDAGADDYLAKPFAVAELLARVRALGRRGPVLRDETIVAGPVEIDLGGRRVTVAGKSIPMTGRELAIIGVLAKNGGNVVTREVLMEAIWGKVGNTVANSLEVLLARIRRKRCRENGFHSGPGGGRCRSSSSGSRPSAWRRSSHWSRARRRRDQPPCPSLHSPKVGA
jgi:DNA-binding response OmpR family regulator